MRAFLFSQGIRVVRIHTGGEFHSARYARKWGRIIAKSPKVRFFTYTRAWRVPMIRTELEALATLPNLALWYSCDRDTGWPDHVPPRIRIAWLMTAADDHPPAEADLVFRTLALRKQPGLEVAGVPVCPAENGFDPSTTCDRCRLCWRSAEPRRLALPMLIH